MLTYSSLSQALADERERALREKARGAWQRRQRGDLKLREARDDDATDLLRLARLDSRGRPPAGTLLVAVDRGELVAAVSVETGDAIANPFHSTAAIVAMLQARAERMRPAAARPRRGWRRRLALES